MKWFLFFVIFLSTSVQAAGMSGHRKILSIGCHNTDPICYISIEGDPVGPSSCRTTSVRWDSSTLPGKNHFSLLMAAYLAEKPVNLFIPDTCFAMQPNFPTFDYSGM